MKIVLPLTVLLWLVVTSSVFAQPYAWTDDDGKVHVTAEKAGVPEKYKKSAVPVGPTKERMDELQRKRDENERNKPVREDKKKETIDEPKPKDTTQQATSPEIRTSTYPDIRDLTNNFKRMTNIQQKEWVKNNEWKYYVTGYGLVSEVELASIFSEIKGNYYEVTIELQGGNRAVVSYSKTPNNDWVKSISKGSILEFKGRLKTIKDWGFWVSGYVRGE